MKHYRILEKKIPTFENYSKQYTIQYLNMGIFGLFYWKNLDNNVYHKYEEALNAVKKVIVKEDYETPTIGYHYIDAYKIFKTTKK